MLSQDAFTFTLQRLDAPVHKHSMLRLRGTGAITTLHRAIGYSYTLSLVVFHV